MKQKHIDCLKKLVKLTHCYDEIIDFLKQEKFLSSIDEAELNMEVDKVSYLCKLLFKYSEQEKFQLLSFDWVMLPKERIRLRMVTDMQTKEISYHF